MPYRATGTAFVDDTVRDILYALRTFRRAPLCRWQRGGVYRLRYRSQLRLR